MPSKKKTLNYFERQQKKLHPKKYRFYFFDYMYYCGEKWGEKSFRISGMIVFFSYWSFCFVLPLSLYLSSISVLSHTDGWHIVGVMAFGIIPPVVWFRLMNTFLILFVLIIKKANHSSLPVLVL